MEKTLLIRGRRIRKRFLRNLPQNPELRERARKLRKSRNLAEVVFWLQVHKKMFHGLDFGRQYVIGNYIADFYVRSLGLVIEIDGCSHNGRETYDERREEYMRSLGVLIFRVTDYDVLHSLGWVMQELEEFILKNYGE
ncbi:MAG: DUF559 domain-containing protein [Bacteroidales bacterium]|nr:DUF559 domain-containing protein [Bacteroidales bacterium]